MVISEERRKKLDQQCHDTLKRAYRPNTYRNYRSRSNIYFCFCEFYRMSPFPAEEWQLIRYARYLGNGMTSYDSVKGYVSAVKRLHEIGGYEFPKNIHLLKLEMRGLKLEMDTPVKKAIPMTPKILREIYQHVNLQVPVQVMAYTALVVGFYLFLRKSNLVPDTEGGFNQKEQLTRGDIWTYGNLTMVNITWSKTRQYRQKPLPLPLLRAKHKEVCPVFWVTYVLSKFPGDPGDPMFSYFKESKRVPLTYDVLATWLKDWVKATGRSPEGYTLHGLRRGGSNFALTCGFATEDLKLMGGWLSDAYMEYLDLTLERRVVNMVRFVDEVDNIVGEEQFLDEPQDVFLDY